MNEHRELIDKLVFEILCRTHIEGRRVVDREGRAFSLDFGVSEPRLGVRKDGILHSDGVYGAPPGHPDLTKPEWVFIAQLYEYVLMPEVAFYDEADNFGYAYSMSADLALALCPVNLREFREEGIISNSSFEYKLDQVVDTETRLKLYARLKQFPRNPKEEDLIKIDEIVLRLCEENRKMSCPIF